MLIRLAVVILCRRLYWRQQGVAGLDEFFVSHLLCYPPLALCILENGVPLQIWQNYVHTVLTQIRLGFCFSTYFVNIFSTVRLLPFINFWTPVLFKGYRYYYWPWARLPVIINVFKRDITKNLLTALFVFVHFFGWYFESVYMIL